MAVGDFIKVDTSLVTATLAPELLRFVEAVRNVIELAEQVKGAMDHMTTDQITEVYGLAPTAGLAALVQGLVTNSRSAVRSAATLEIIDRVRPGRNT